MSRITLPVGLAFVLGCAHTPLQEAVTPTTCLPCPEPAKVAEPAAKNPVLGVDGAKDALIRHINAREAAAIFAMFSPAMKEAVPLDKLEPWTRSIIEHRGAISGATAISESDRKGKYRLHAERGEWLLELTVGTGGEILGMKITDPPPPEPPVVRSTISLGLPFRDRWFVFWGGDSLELNQHIQHASQRRAADLIVVDDHGKSFRSDGRRNEDYYAYGKEILAAADGKVVTVIDGVPDNEPGSMNPYFALGNAVIVEHESKVYSVYAHLKPHSVRAKVGAKIRRGQVLGLCGNTGNSSEPHLHFQLQDGPLFEKSWGIEPAIAGVQVVRDGKTLSGVDAYTFRKGDIVISASK